MSRIGSFYNLSLRYILYLYQFFLHTSVAAMWQVSSFGSLHIRYKITCYVGFRTFNQEKDWFPIGYNISTKYSGLRTRIFKHRVHRYLSPASSAYLILGNAILQQCTKRNQFFKEGGMRIHHLMRSRMNPVCIFGHQINKEQLKGWYEY